MPRQLLPEHDSSLRERISALGLSKFRTDILRGCYSSYLLIGDKQSSSRKLGVSRFGGNPDIPASFDVSQLEELVFLFQINLTDIPSGAMLGLPETGLLSIFCDQGPDTGKTFHFDNRELKRHRMPAPDPDYIFADMKEWNLRIATDINIPFDDDAVEDAGLDSEYELLRETDFCTDSGRAFGELLGRFSDLNGDMREDAADECGGKRADWLSLWKVFSTFESGLVISDFHRLHGMIRKRHLKTLKFDKMYSTSSNG